jgi:hypothetical protein
MARWFLGVRLDGAGRLVSNAGNAEGYTQSGKYQF